MENGIPLVRCANNGLTCWVDSRGGMHLDPLQTLDSGPSRNVYTAGFKVVDVPLLEPGEKHALTFYTRHGDWFGWGCVGWVLLAGMGMLRRQGVRTHLKPYCPQPANDDLRRADVLIHKRLDCGGRPRSGRAPRS